MAQVIDQLGRDHHNFRILLDIVEEEMIAYQEGQVPDFDLLEEIAEYALLYLDLVHHPTEDLIFERLVMRDPCAKADIGKLVEEHKRLAELARKFAAAIGNAAHDVELPREWLVSLVSEFLWLIDRICTLKRRISYPAHWPFSQNRIGPRSTKSSYASMIRSLERRWQTSFCLFTRGY